MNVRQAAVLGLAALFIAACGEIDTTPTQPSGALPRIEAPTDGPSQALSTSQDPPSSVPDEYQHYTWIDVEADAGWYDAHTAYGQAIVRFGGNNATASVDLEVRSSSGTVIGSNHGSSQVSYIFPGDHVLWATTTVYVTPTCGSVAQATARGAVWDSFLSANQSTMTWGRHEGSGTKSAAQPVCDTQPAPPPASPTGGDGTTTASTGSSSEPPSWYDPTAPTGPAGYYWCEDYYLGTDYQTTKCWFIPYNAARSGPTAPSLSRNALSSPARSVQGAELPSVFVIVTDQIPAGATAVIERHRTGPFRNVLLIPSSTFRPAALVAAMRALSDSRARDGDSPARDLRLLLMGDVPDQAIPASARTYAAPFTALIASAKRTDAGAYGTRPVLEIRLGTR